MPVVTPMPLPARITSAYDDVWIIERGALERMKWNLGILDPGLKGRREASIMPCAKSSWRRAAQRMSILAMVALLVCAGGERAGAATGSHAAIAIQSDADFASCGCVTGGSGTASDPYIIGPWSINNVGGAAVSIDGTTLTKSFTLSNLTIAGNG